MKQTSKTTAKLEAIPYARFSSGKQEKGDSERRQANGFNTVCSRYADRLTPSARFAFGRFFDRGISGFHGANMEGGELSAILSLIKSGEIEPNRSAIVIDELSRLTRLPPVEAVDLLKRIVQAGVTVVVNSPDLWIDRDGLNGTGFIIIAVLLQQFHGESLTKSRHAKEKWEQRRATKQATRCCPAWIVLDNGEYRFANDSDGKVGGFPKLDAATLKQAVAMAIDGNGCHTIRHRLGLSGSWGKLPQIFRQTELMGITQDKNTNGEKVGEPYQKYPALISETDWHRLQASIDGRTLGGTGRARGGRRGNHVANLFTDLLIDVKTTQPMIVRLNGRQRTKILISRTLPSKEQCGVKYSGQAVRYELFETAVLRFLRELTPADVAPKDDSTTEEKNAVAGKLAQVRRQAAEFAEQLGTNGASGRFIFSALARLEAQENELTERLNSLKREASNSQAEALTACQTVAELLETAEGEQLDEMRARAKGLIRTLITRILVKATSRWDAELTINLASGQVRKVYLIDGEVKGHDTIYRHLTAVA